MLQEILPPHIAVDCIGQGASQRQHCPPASACPPTQGMHGRSRMDAAIWDQRHEKWHIILDGVKVHCLAAGLSEVCWATNKDAGRRTFKDKDAIPHESSYVMHSALAVEVPSFLGRAQLVC